MRCYKRMPYCICNRKSIQYITVDTDRVQSTEDSDQSVSKENKQERFPLDEVRRIEGTGGVGRMREIRQLGSQINEQEYWKRVPTSVSPTLHHL